MGGAAGSHGVAVHCLPDGALRLEISSDVQVIRRVDPVAPGGEE